MCDGELRIDIAFVFRELKTCTHTSTADQRVEVVLLNSHAVCRRERITGYAAIGEFNLRLDKGQIIQIKAPAKLCRKRIGIVVKRSVKAVKREVSVKTHIFGDHVQEHAVLSHPRAIDAKTVCIIVSITVVIFGRAVCIVEGCAYLEARSNLNVRPHLNGVALLLDILVAILKF